MASGVFLHGDIISTVNTKEAWRDLFCGGSQGPPKGLGGEVVTGEQEL